MEQRLGIFWTPLVTIVAGTIAMAWISIINEAPLTMLGDSGGILRSVLFGYTDKFRTVFYRWIVMLTAGKYSLFPLMFLQNLLLIVCLVRAQRLLFPQTGIFLILLTIGAVATGTVVSFYSNMVKEDIFTPILVLSVICFLFEKRKTTATAFGLLVILALLIHQSHFAVLGGILIGMGFARTLVAKCAMPGRTRLLWAALITGFIAVPLSNFWDKRQLGFPPGSQLNLLGRLHAAGLLTRYLSESCPSEFHPFCPHLNSELSKASRWQLLFSPSPQMRELLKNHSLLRATNISIMKSYPSEFISEIFRNVLLLPTQRSETWHLRPDSRWQDHQDPLAKHYREISASLQYRNEKWLTDRYLSQTRHQGWLAAIGLGILLIIPLTRRELQPTSNHHATVALVLICAIVGNAFITAGLVNVESRYHIRLEWILSWYGLAFFASSFQQTSNSISRRLINYTSKHLTATIQEDSRNGALVNSGQLTIEHLRKER